MTPTDLADCLPDYAVAAIREALPGFDRQIKGFALADAVMTGVETRTSSPIRIPRDDDFRASTRAGFIRPARARAMRAAFCRPASTASASPKPWR